jgi:hypothetical protein
MAARVILLLATVFIGLSLATLAVVCLVAVGVVARTVAGAARRAKRRREGSGALAGSFSEKTLAGLDEAMERVWNEEQRRLRASR